ncbi:MAG: cytosine deaminase [Kyrpidia sp.]|nr:cytosine deaminase [Kyrpidia sp.]
MLDLIVRRVRLPGSECLTDIGIADGIIVKTGEISDSARRELDGCGDLALPPFVESHIHLDTVLTAGVPRWNESGTLLEGVRIWSEYQSGLTRKDVLDRAQKVIEWQMVQGILHVRTHVDISDPNLTALYTLLELRETVSPYMNLQIVAFPQEGLLACPGNQERLEEAARSGVDALGAIPHYEHTREMGVESLRTCFGLAEKYGLMVNVFCDEMDDDQSRFLEVTAALALSSGLKAKVTASHAVALSLYPDAYAVKLFHLLQRAEINVVACPLVNSVMQGRFDRFPKSRGITRLKELWEAGVNVSLGHDDILTPFYPLGTGNMLHAAYMAVHLAHMTGYAEIEETVNMVTTRGAKTLQIEEKYGIEPGKPANLITLPVTSKFDAVRLQPKCRYVISNGRLVARTWPETSELCLHESPSLVEFHR